jgi:predicted nuclease of predicted toxin-antitoxin system
VKFLVDENVATSVAQLLRNPGHDVKTVQQAGLAGAEDDVIIRLALDEERVIVTHDKDFGAILRYPLKQHGGVILLRLHRPTPQNAARALERVLATVPRERMMGRVVVVEDARIRVSGKRR